MDEQIPPSKPPLFVVMGFPIEHSLSPNIHTIFSKTLDVPISYERMEVLADKVTDALQTLKLRGAKGANITAPLKEVLFLNTQNMSDRARHAQAINTITLREDGSIWGDNTDGIGFVRDLTDNNAVTVSGKKILVIGAGGAARGILRPLLGLEPRKIDVVNRSRPKALELVDYFKPWGKVRVQEYDKLKKAQYDIIIHATSAGLQGELPPLPEGFSPRGASCYDLSYQEAAKPFLEWAKKKGATRTIDGLGMLVEQAAESFFQWHQKRPKAYPVIQQVRNILEHAQVE